VAGFDDDGRRVQASCRCRLEKGPHRLFILGGDIGHCQVPIWGQTLFLAMAAESRRLGADEAFLGQTRDELVPEEMRLHPSLNLCGQGVGVNHVADAAGGVRPETIGLEEGHRPTRLRSLHVLEELASDTGREQHGPVSASLLHHTAVGSRWCARPSSPAREFPPPTESG
jgi:hypothetical protein